jgi:hypothetical protein
MKGPNSSCLLVRNSARIFPGGRALSAYLIGRGLTQKLLTWGAPLSGGRALIDYLIGRGLIQKLLTGVHPFQEGAPLLITGGAPLPGGQGAHSKVNQARK